MSNIFKFSVREWLVPPVLLPIFFVLLVAAGDAYLVVVALGGPPPSAQANSSSAPMKRTESSVADELNIRAVAALDEAREMPPGDGRAEVMN